MERQSGASGHPLMTAEAIRAAAQNFHACIERILFGGPPWNFADCLSNHRLLTPDLRIMDLLDNQPEFTKSFWDYLDIR